MRRVIIAILAGLLLAGCGTAYPLPGPSGPPDTRQPEPSPTATTLGQSCVINATKPFDPFYSGGTMPSYTATLRNNTGSNVTITGLDTVFSYGDGQEITSDQQQAAGLILPGQSLSWNFQLPSSLFQTAVIRKGTATHDEVDEYIVLAGKCQVAQWYSQ